MTSVTLHVLVDASKNTYGVVIYMRSEYTEGKVSLPFVASKTKVVSGLASLYLMLGHTFLYSPCLSISIV